VLSEEKKNKNEDVLQNAEMSNEVFENKFQKMHIKILNKKEVCYFVPFLQLCKTKRVFLP
jgi:hypothetical protein